MSGKRKAPDVSINHARRRVGHVTTNLSPRETSQSPGVVKVCSEDVGGPASSTDSVSSKDSISSKGGRNMEEDQKGGKEGTTEERSGRMPPVAGVCTMSRDDIRVLIRRLSALPPKTRITTVGTSLSFIKPGHIKELLPGRMIEDEAMNYYASTLLHSLSPATASRLRYVSPDFFSVYSYEKYNYHSLRSRLRLGPPRSTSGLTASEYSVYYDSKEPRVNFFALDRAIFPICLGQHWSIIVVFIQHQTMWWVDSLTSSIRVPASAREPMNLVYHFIHDEWLREGRHWFADQEGKTSDPPGATGLEKEEGAVQKARPPPLREDGSIDFREWKSCCQRPHGIDPQQGGLTCGLFAAYILDRCIRAPLLCSPTLLQYNLLFRKQHIGPWRRYIIRTLLHQAPCPIEAEPSIACMFDWKEDTAF